LRKKKSTKLKKKIEENKMQKPQETNADTGQFSADQ